MRRLWLIPISLHVVIENLLAIAVIASPFIFGFEGAGATVAAVTVGLAWLLVSLLSDTPMAAARVISMRAHEGFDYLAAATLLVLPIATGLLDERAALAFFIAAGLGHFVLTLATRFVHKRTETAEPPAAAVDETPKA